MIQGDLMKITKKRTLNERAIEARNKITTPMPVNRITTRLRLTSPQFKELVEKDILVFVDNKRGYKGGKLPKRYIATGIKTRINEKCQK